MSSSSGMPPSLVAAKRCSSDRVIYEATEDIARTERRGLWVDPDPVLPWEWRKKKRANR